MCVFKSVVGSWRGATCVLVDGGLVCSIKVRSIALRLEVARMWRIGKRRPNCCWCDHGNLRIDGEVLHPHHNNTLSNDLLSRFTLSCGTTDGAKERSR